MGCRLSEVCVVSAVPRCCIVVVDWVFDMHPNVAVIIVKVIKVSKILRRLLMTLSPLVIYDVFIYCFSLLCFNSFLAICKNIILYALFDLVVGYGHALGILSMIASSLYFIISALIKQIKG